MKTIAAGKFKATCLAVMDEVEKKRQPIVVTKHGRPVVKITPMEPEAEDPIFGLLKDYGRVVGDVESPIFPLEDYEMLK